MMNKIKRSEKVWIFKFKRCEDTGKLLWPFTRAWHCFYMNYGGIVVGAPPVETDFWLSSDAFMIRCLKGNVD